MRHSVAALIVLACVLLVACPWAIALDPSLDVDQYAHTAWKVREGLGKGSINSIAQTPDGYLWLGTEFGLLRFDGVRAVPWQAPAGEQLPSDDILRLRVTRDGRLWIGTLKGLASWKDNKLTRYPELASQTVYALLEDQEGTLWVASSTSAGGGLCAIQSGGIRCDDKGGALGHGEIGLFEDRKGNLWVGAEKGLWRWRPGPPEFHPMPDKLIGGFADGDNGALLVTTRSGVKQFIDGKMEPYPLPGSIRPFPAYPILRDREGGLWIGSLNRGLVHVHGGRADVFSQSDGLTGDVVEGLLEDREGNIWVATSAGLDRFRDFAVATFSVKQGLSDPIVGSILADRNGSVWIADYGGLNRWNHGQITAYGNPEKKLNEIVKRSLFQDSRGRIWISNNREFGYLENNQFVPIRGIPDSSVHGIAEDTQRNLWIANEEALFRLSSRGEVEQIPWGRLGHKDYAWALAADPFQGGVWLGFTDGGTAYFRDGELRASYATADGLGAGRVSRFQLDPDGTVWVATEGGLSRLKNGRVATLTSKNGLHCNTVHWVIEDNDHSFWLYMPCGLTRIARSELDAWGADIDKGKDSRRTFQATVFDISDGVRTRASSGYYNPQVTKSSDGKLWFSRWDGVSVVNPRHIPFNNLVPPVYVEQIVADRKKYVAMGEASANIRLPPHIRDLEIDYTALSFVVPEKVRFRYMLEGRDISWQEPGTRRQAFYNDLSPGKYRFHVIACNNDGVWNENGATLDFSIAPAWYQTKWFLGLCIIVGLFLIYALYRLRVREVAKALSARFDERLAERTRMAQELHDTFLQTIQGSKLVADNALKKSDDPERMRRAVEQLSVWLEQATQEGRAALNSLRTSTTQKNDLAEALKRATKECRLIGPIEVSFSVTGDSKELHPVVRDEIYRVGYEAIRNACKHSRGSRLGVELKYGHDLALHVKDDGVGIDPTIGDHGTEGHFGLQGMHERVARIGGKLTVASSASSGTEITVVVPGGIVFREPSASPLDKIRTILRRVGPSTHRK